MLFSSERRYNILLWRNVNLRWVDCLFYFSSELDQEIVVLEREQSNFSAKVEEYRTKEREWREKISEDSRELEKATNKQVSAFSNNLFVCFR